MFKRYLFQKVAIVGMGLLGGSLALALKKNQLAKKVVGTSRKEASIALAIKRGLIDEGTVDIHQAVQHADLIVLASPVNVILEQLKNKAFIKSMKRGVILTDVGSTKSAIVQAAQKHLPKHVLFIGSHPIAGSEKSGFENATADLFQGANCVVTPVETTNKLAKDKIQHLWKSVGANIVLMDPFQHDEIFSFVSHLPHVAAFALMRAIPEPMIGFAAAGLKDTTRIAGSSVKMWNDICDSNYRLIVKAIDELVSNLSEMRNAIVHHDENALTKILTQAKAKREKLIQGL